MDKHTLHIRELRTDEHPLLREFLLRAIYLPEPPLRPRSWKAPN